MLLPHRIETIRLALRPHLKDDFEGFYSFLTHPEKDAFISFSSEERTREGSLAFFEEILASYETNQPVFGLAIEEKKTGNYVGFCGLASHEMGAEVFYVILQDYRGKGFAKEALKALFSYGLDNLNLKCLVCYIHPQNEGGTQAAQKLGMTDEGLVKHEAYEVPVHRFVIRK